MAVGSGAAIPAAIKSPANRARGDGTTGACGPTYYSDGFIPIDSTFIAPLFFVPSLIEVQYAYNNVPLILRRSDFLVLFPKCIEILHLILFIIN